MSAGREMTLSEWMAQLPESHRANKEYRTLLAQYEAMRKSLEAIVGAARGQHATRHDIALLAESALSTPAPVEAPESQTTGRSKPRANSREYSDHVAGIPVLPDMPAQTRQSLACQAEGESEMSSLKSALLPAPVVANKSEREAALEDTLRRCAEIVERNLYHQREKVEDVLRIVHEALASSPSKPGKDPRAYPQSSQEEKM